MNQLTYTQRKFLQDIQQENSDIVGLTSCDDGKGTLLLQKIDLPDGGLLWFPSFSLPKPFTEVVEIYEALPGTEFIKKLSMNVLLSEKQIEARDGYCINSSFPLPADPENLQKILLSLSKGTYALIPDGFRTEVRRFRESAGEDFYGPYDFIPVPYGDFQQVVNNLDWVKRDCVRLNASPCGSDSEVLAEALVFTI